jgi:uncharacterized protein (TIGR02453 family)
MFRIYRDIRFSRDKRPYKPMASAALTRSGERMDPGVLYIHVEPGKSFLGCGFWQPLPQLLEAWRREMIRKPLAFLSVLRAIEAKGHSLESGELRKRLPRGFETASGTAIAPYLLWNSFISRREIPDDELQSAELPQRILTFAQASRPLLDYGWALMPGGSASVRDDANPRDVKPERRRASSRK